MRAKNRPKIEFAVRLRIRRRARENIGCVSVLRCQSGQSEIRRIRREQILFIRRGKSKIPSLIAQLLSPCCLQRTELMRNEAFLILL